MIGKNKQALLESVCFKAEGTRKNIMKRVG